MSECIYQKFFKRSTLTVLGAALVFMLICIVINFYYDWLSLWKKDKNVIWSLLIILFYLYPFLYSSVKQILKKKKEFSEIYSNNNLEKLENNLNQFEFYSIGEFLAELFKQFSSLWIFIFVQKIFEQVSSEQMEVVKLQAYWGMIKISVIISVVTLIIFGTFSGAVQLIPIKKIHVKMILKLKKIQIERFSSRKQNQNEKSQMLIKSLLHNMNYSVDVAKTPEIDYICCKENKKYGIVIKHGNDNLMNLRIEDVDKINKESIINEYIPTYAFIIDYASKIDIIIIPQKYLLKKQKKNADSVNINMKKLKRRSFHTGSNVILTCTYVKNWNN